MRTFAFLFLCVVATPAAAQHLPDIYDDQHLVAVVALKISSDASDGYDVSLTASTLISSSKSLPSVDKAWNQDDLVCLVLDAEGRRLHTIVLGQPLKVRFEYPEDDGSIGSAIIDVREHDVIVHFPFDESVHALQIAIARDEYSLHSLKTLHWTETR